MNVQDGVLNIHLSSHTTIKRYKELEALKDKGGIAQFIGERFTERYITPIDRTPYPHGFLFMAVCCLMIETLQSFREGWADTNGKSKCSFKRFFDQTKELSEFKDVSENFYYKVRCGILHQAETTGGWKIRRSGLLFDRNTLTINANAFLSRLKTTLAGYQSDLQKAEWDSTIWNNCRKKMDAVIKNCERGS